MKDFIEDCLRIALVIAFSIAALYALALVMYALLELTRWPFVGSARKLVAVLMAISIWIGSSEMLRIYILNKKSIVFKSGYKDVREKLFLISGVMNKADEIFRFAEELGGDIGYIEYSNFGFSPQITANNLRLAVESLRKNEIPIIVSFDIGDQVITELIDNSSDKRTLHDKIETYAINPCPSIDCLSSDIASQLTVMKKIFMTVAVFMGPLSFLPVMSSSEGLISMRLAADQIQCFGRTTDHRLGDLRDGVVFSANSSLLNVDAIMRRFYNSRFEFANCADEDSESCRNMHREALLKLRNN